MDPVMGYDPTLESWEGEDPGEAIIPEKPLEEKTADPVIDTAMDHYLDEKDGQVDTFANETNEAGFDPILGMEDLKSLEREINVGIEQLDYLLDLQERLKLAKGINRSLGLEAIERVPDFKFQSDRFFTTHTSTVNYQPSMESIGSKIKEFIKKLWAKLMKFSVSLIDMMEPIVNWIYRIFKKQEKEQERFFGSFGEYLKKYGNSPMSDELNSFSDLVVAANNKKNFLTNLLESERIGFRNYCFIHIVDGNDPSHVAYVKKDLHPQFKHGIYTQTYEHLSKYLGLLERIRDTVKDYVKSESSDRSVLEQLLKDIDLDLFELEPDYLNDNLFARFTKEKYDAKLKKDAEDFRSKPISTAEFIKGLERINGVSSKSIFGAFDVLTGIDKVQKDIERFSRELKHDHVVDELLDMTDILKKNEYYDRALDAIKTILSYLNKAIANIPGDISVAYVINTYQYNYYLSTKRVLDECIAYIDSNPKVKWTKEAKFLVNVKARSPSLKVHDEFLDKDFA